MERISATNRPSPNMEQKLTVGQADPISLVVQKILASTYSKPLSILDDYKQVALNAGKMVDLAHPYSVVNYPPEILEKYEKALDDQTNETACLRTEYEQKYQKARDDRNADEAIHWGGKLGEFDSGVCQDVWFDLIRSKAGGIKDAIEKATNLRPEEKSWGFRAIIHFYNKIKFPEASLTFFKEFRCFLKLDDQTILFKEFAFLGCSGLVDLAKATIKDNRIDLSSYYGKTEPSSKINKWVLELFLEAILEGALEGSRPHVRDEALVCLDDEQKDQVLTNICYRFINKYQCNPAFDAMSFIKNPEKYREVYLATSVWYGDDEKEADEIRKKARIPTNLEEFNEVKDNVEQILNDYGKLLKERWKSRTEFK